MTPPTVPNTTPAIESDANRAVLNFPSSFFHTDDFSENLQQRIDLEKPIDDLLENATKDVFGESIKKTKKHGRKK